MRTYEDLLEIEDSDQGRLNFVLSAILEYKSSDMYKEADVARDYFKRRNRTIREYQKLLYLLSGEAVPDNFSANYKFCNSFFRVFVLQQTAYLLGNGVTFDEDATKDALGGPKFDRVLIKAATGAVWGGVAYGFLNKDHVDVYNACEFVPLFGEEDGGLHAGIRWWQVDSTKPLRATLFEEDGYTDFIWRYDKKNQQVGNILHAKRPYVQTIGVSVADGEEILDGRNYPGFPHPLRKASKHAGVGEDANARILQREPGGEHVFPGRIARLFQEKCRTNRGRAKERGRAYQTW